MPDLTCALQGIRHPDVVPVIDDPTVTFRLFRLRRPGTSIFIDTGFCVALCLHGMTMRIVEIATARKALLAMTNEEWQLVII
jgi:hypothetical protein